MHNWLSSTRRSAIPSASVKHVAALAGVSVGTVSNVLNRPERVSDAVLQRVKDENLAFGSGPFSAEDGEINHHFGGRGFYFRDPNGHLLEIITHTYV